MPKKPKTETYKPLHPERLAHPLEKALREEWEELTSKEKATFDLLSGPTTNQIPENRIFDTCRLTGGVIPYPYGRMTARDRMVAAEVIQWLGSGVGFNFLSRAFQKAGGKVEFDDYKKP